MALEIPLEQILSHPLFLLLVGAGFSSFLIPWFSNRWQDHKKGLEVKINLVSTVAKLLSEIYAAGAASAMRKKATFTSEEVEAIFEQLARWHAEGNVIRSQILAYFKDKSLGEAYDRHANSLLTWYDMGMKYFQTDPENKKTLEENIEFLKKRVVNDKDFDLSKLSTTYDPDTWDELARYLRARTDSILVRIIQAPFKGFNRKLW